MRLSTRSLLALFAVGAACGLIGDHAHVESGATRYLDVGGVPMIWGSPLFFMISVGLATAALAEIGLRLGGPRGGSAWDGLAAAASVLAIYLVTAVLADESTSTVTALIACLAALVLVRFGEARRGAIVCGALAAIVGPLVEIVEQRAGIFEYTANVDGLWGVAPWLVPLYFAFGVVAVRLGEPLAAAQAAEA